MRFITGLVKGLVRWVAGFLGAILLVTGLAALGFLGAVLMAGGGLVDKSLGQVWFQHDPFLSITRSPSIQLVQVFFERKLALPFLWDPAALTLLNWPAPLALAALAGAAFVMALVFLALTRAVRR